MKFLPCILLAFLTACTASRTPTILVSPQRAAPGIDNLSLRCPETIQAYQVGRYTEPGNDLILHEQQTVYRVEASSRWSLYPGPGPVESAAASLSSEPAFPPFPVNDAILAEVNSQKLATAQITTQARTLSAALGQFQTALEQTRTNLQETTALRAVLKQMAQRLDALEAVPRPAPSIIQQTNDTKNAFPIFVPAP